MQVFIPLWIAEALFAALFIVTGYPVSTKKGFVFKMIACALYTANGLYAFAMSGREIHGVTILLGLACGWLGDVFLALDPFVRHKSDRKLSLTLTSIGGVFFLLGHFAYMFAFLYPFLTSHTFRFLPFALAMSGILLCFAAVFRLSKVSAGKLLVPVAVYAVGLGAMFALAVCAALQTSADRIVLRIILIAAPLLFAFSDVTLALRVADKDRFESLPMRTVCLGAYFLAQMLFGLILLA